MAYPIEKLPEHYNELFEKLKMIAMTYHYNGRLADAVAVLKSAVALSEHSEVKKSQHFDLLQKYGDYLTCEAAMQTGTFDEALRVAEKLLAIANHNIQKAQAVNLIGQVYYQQALNSKEPNFLKSRAYFEKAYSLLKYENHPQSFFWATLHIGRTHQNSNEIEQASIYFRQAEILARKHKLELELSYARQHHGFILQTQKEFKKALAAHQEVLALRERIGYKIALPKAHLTLAKLHEEMEQPEQALDLYERAIIAAREIELARPLLLTLLYYGINLQNASRFVEAQIILEEAKTYAVTLGHEKGLAIIEEKLSQIQITP